jgi:hypothetical protein
MSDGKIEKNDQARSRGDGNRPGEWPGSGTTVDGPVETATTGIGGNTGSADADPTNAGATNADSGRATTSGPTIEPDDVVADKPKN